MVSYWLREKGKVIRDPIWDYIYITPEVERLIDTIEFQKLRHISQLGHVVLVYPGARHSRFEHSLGVYHLAKIFLRRLLDSDPPLRLENEDIAVFIAAALLHDIGHYPFSHILEELHIFFEDHEKRARFIIENKNGEIYNVLKHVWGISPDRVANVIDYRDMDIPDRDLRLARILSGTLDPDKIDYLLRDSRYCGVPFGESVNKDRLISSIVYDEEAETLAINHKGISAIEALIFTNYLMYRNVYWHHTARSAVALFKTILFELLSHPDNGLKPSDFYLISEYELMDLIESRLLDLKMLDYYKLLKSLKRRRLYKRGVIFYAWELNKIENEVLYTLYREPEKRRQLENIICKYINKKLNANLKGYEVLIDIPKFGKSLQIDLHVFMPDEVCKRKKNPFTFDDFEVTQLKKHLIDNFDQYAKTFHVFYHPDFANVMNALNRSIIFDLYKKLI